MKKILNITFCLAVLFLFSNAASESLPPGPIEDITVALKAGNSKELGKYFGSTVEIILPGREGAFSKAQAEIIMKDFFARSEPVSFIVNQKSNSAGASQFVIGTYKNKSETLNVYILLRSVSNQLLIQQIHFEAD